LGGSIGYALSAASLAASLWPVLLGVVLALALQRWGGHLPRAPDGDIVVLVAARVERVAGGTAAYLERLDAFLRQWPVAVLSLLAVVVILAALMFGRS
jgi:hypothetical protein